MEHPARLSETLAARGPRTAARTGCPRPDRAFSRHGVGEVRDGRGLEVVPDCAANGLERLVQRTEHAVGALAEPRCTGVEIARALCISPKFILLDEPFSGIDPIAVLDLQKIIFDLKANGIGVLVTDHNVRETLSVTDRAYIINEGRIFRTGTPEQLGNDPEVKRVYLGESFSFV